jgi:hypothetical protein
MNTLSTFAIAALVAAGVAAPASAASFTPENTFFSATGPVTISTPQGNLACTMTAQGIVTGGGEVEFLNASLSGNTADPTDCFTNTFALTPYYVIGKATRQGEILGVSGFGNIFSPCGPGGLAFSADDTGVWTLKTTTLQGGCTISGSLTTSPAITIAPQ